MSQIENKNGIEIGGPSAIFGDSGYLPVYKIAQNIDGCNFSAQTIWEGTLKEGENYQYYPKKVGYQFILDGSDLNKISDSQYDFLLSCHNIEHYANPIKALLEWKRVVKENGTLVIVFPNPKFNFDHQRPITPFLHIVKDFENKISEDDLTHVDEIVRLHDRTLDNPNESIADLKNRLLDNINLRSIHHHVFDRKLIEDIFSYLNMPILFYEETNADLIAVIRNNKKK